MERLIENNEKIDPVCAQLLDVLDDAGGKLAVSELLQHWTELDELKIHYQQYLQQNGSVIPSSCEESYAHDKISPFSRNDNRRDRNDNVVIPSASEESMPKHKISPGGRNDYWGDRNDSDVAGNSVIPNESEESYAYTESSTATVNARIQAQQEGKRTSTDRKTKALKSALEELHQDVKNAELYFQHIHWLQERFPNAQYEDVTGLCKLATPEEVQEQDYSLNPGRYVGVVIEEDGKSEEEFIAELLAVNDEFEKLSLTARKLEEIITQNIKVVANEI